MAETKHLIVTVHGIRTYGNWQDDLKNLLQVAEPDATVLSYRYGFFSSLAFLVPPMRWVVARRFRNFFVQVVQSAPEGTRIDLVAHSFGTYLAASALPYVPKGRKIHTVILAGSVLRPTFPWFRYRQADTVGRVINECGWDDSVLLLCQSVALLMGMAGRVGFHGMLGEGFVNRYYRFGHGGYFERPGFLAENWVPLLTRNDPIPPHDERPRLTHAGGLKLFFLNNLQFFKVAIAFALLLAVVMLPLDWWRARRDQWNIARRNRISQLANAQYIPGRDPQHVRDLLKLDSPSADSSSTIDILVPTDAPDGAEDASVPEDETGWAEWVLRAFDPSRLADKARLEHARANRQLIVGKAGGQRNVDKAIAHFEQAVECYAKVSHDDPAYGSYALCLIDYGQLLSERGEYDKAIAQFKKVRDEVFSRDGEVPTAGGRPLIPDSVKLETLVYETDALKKLNRWADAELRLDQAIALAKEKGGNALKADAYNPSAWLNMERLQIRKAEQDFKAAEEACEALVDSDQFVYRVRQFHNRHGLAMATRLQGNADRAYDAYRQIVADLRAELGNNLKFTPKQRRDLRDRLINSYERLADVYLFAWPGGSRFRDVAQAPEVVTTAVDTEPGSAVATIAAFTATDTKAEARREVLERMAEQLEDDYQAALDLVGNEVPETRVRLLFKKVIARFLAEIDLNHTIQARATEPHRVPPGPIDLEFDEASRILGTLTPQLRNDLSFYHDVAAACMELRRNTVKAPKAGKPVRFAPSAVAKFRELTDTAAGRSEKWGREKVEVLLLSMEVLLRPEVECDPVKLASDATQMMAVLGAWTKVASHPELAGYFKRYQTIASAFTGESPAAIAQRRSPAPALNPVPAEPPPAPPAPAVGTAPAGEKLLFFLQLRPGVALKLVADPKPTPPAAPLLTAEPAPRTERDEPRRAGFSLPNR